MQKFILNRYERKQLIESNKLNQVLVCRDNKNDELKAIKIIELPYDATAIHTLIKLQIQKIKSLNHPHIIKILDYSEQEIEYETSDQKIIKKIKIYIVMPYHHSGSLHKKIKKNYEIHCLKIYNHIRSAIQQLHEQGIPHGQITSNNILIDENGDYILTDIGLINSCLNKYQKEKNFKEMYNQKNLWILKNDLWDFGIVISEILIGKTLKEIINEYPQAYNQFLQTVLKFIDKSVQFRKVLKYLLKENYEQRKFQEIQSFNQYSEELEMLSLEKQEIQKVSDSSISPHKRVQEPKDSQYPQLFKVVVLGFNRPGKSSLINRYVENIFNPKQQKTLNVKLKNKSVKLHGKNRVRLEIWDTPNQILNSNTLKLYTKNTAIILLLYSILEQKKQQLEQWLHTIKQYVNSQTIVILAATKLDLQKQRMISLQLGQKFAVNINSKYFIETSSKLENNVKKLFEKVVKLGYKKFQTNENYKTMIKNQGKINVKTLQQIQEEIDKDNLDYPEVFKIAMIGQSQVGQTKLFCELSQTHLKNLKNESEFNSKIKSYQLSNKKMNIQYIDIAINKNFKKLKIWKKNVAAIILIYKITQSNEQFKNLRQLAKEIKQSSTSILILVGNMCDLETQRKITIQQGKSLAKQINADLFIETSASNNTNITELRSKMITMIISKYQSDKEYRQSLLTESKIGLNREKNQRKSQKCAT